MQVAPDGRRIPVNPEPDASGQLMIDEVTGWLVRAHETNKSPLRYRSHLKDCKSMARALHSTRTIKLPASTCAYPDCTFKGVHTHIDPELDDSEDEIAELEFGNA